MMTLKRLPAAAIELAKWVGFVFACMVFLFIVVRLCVRNENALRAAQVDASAEHRLALQGISEVDARLQMDAFIAGVDQCWDDEGYRTLRKMPDMLWAGKIERAETANKMVAQAEQACTSRLLRSVAMVDPRVARALAAEAGNLGYRLAPEYRAAALQDRMALARWTP